MKLLYNNTDIKRIDELTIQSGVPSLRLISQAVDAFYTWFSSKVDRSNQVFILCGFGNNGAGGWAILEDTSA